MSSQPIGIFDSGIGGLLVVQAIKKLLPEETFIYFGDTAYLPYGNKSATTIQARSLKICDFLLRNRSKMILIACNSASAAAYNVVRAQIGRQVEVLNVIDPMVTYLIQQFPRQLIGLIGTQQTVRSGVYTHKLGASQKDIQVRALATPLLVPMIEASFAHGVINPEIIHHYLRNPALKLIKALVLGCTHYAIIKAQIQAFYQNKVAVLDANQLTAEALLQHLTCRQLLSTNTQVEDRFVVSELTPAFEVATRLLFPQPVHLEHSLI